MHSVVQKRTIHEQHRAGWCVVEVQSAGVHRTIADCHVVHKRRTLDCCRRTSSEHGKGAARSNAFKGPSNHTAVLKAAAGNTHRSVCGGKRSAVYASRTVEERTVC